MLDPPPQKKTTLPSASLSRTLDGWAPRRVSYRSCSGEGGRHPASPTSPFASQLPPGPAPGSWPPKDHLPQDQDGYWGAQPSAPPLLLGLRGSQEPEVVLLQRGEPSTTLGTRESRTCFQPLGRGVPIAASLSPTPTPTREPLLFLSPKAVEEDRRVPGQPPGLGLRPSTIALQQHHDFVMLEPPGVGLTLVGESGPPEKGLESLQSHQGRQCPRTLQSPENDNRNSTRPVGCTWNLESKGGGGGAYFCTPL